LLTYSPYLCFALLLGALQLRNPFAHGYAPAAWSACGAYVLLNAHWADWGGGFSFGPRLLSEVFPFSLIVLASVYSRIRKSRGLLTVFIVLVLFSCLLHLKALYQGDGRWNARVYRDFREFRLWDWQQSQILWTLGVKPEP
jgi:hypothetical protein